MIFRSVKMFQTTQLDRAIAEEFFGWKWWAYFDRPVTSHPEYPKEMMVRRFYPPLESLGKQWQAYLKEQPHTPATGNESLCYSYCSSNGPHMVPHYSGSLDECVAVEKEICKRKLWDDYLHQLAAQVSGKQLAGGKINYRKVHFATPEQRCIAALAVVNSKHIIQGGPDIGSDSSPDNLTNQAESTA